MKKIVILLTLSAIGYSLMEAMEGTSIQQKPEGMQSLRNELIARMRKALNLDIFEVREEMYRQTVIYRQIEDSRQSKGNVRKRGKNRLTKKDIAETALNNITNLSQRYSELKDKKLPSVEHVIASGNIESAGKVLDKLKRASLAIGKTRDIEQLRENAILRDIIAANKQALYAKYPELGSLESVLEDPKN